MSRSIGTLVPAFREQVTTLLEDLALQGHALAPHDTVRSPWEQARLYRKGRATEAILRRAGRLAKAGAPWLADVLVGVGSQYGDTVTNAPPGYSWHQLGEAVDCHVEVEGRAVWDAAHPGYRAYRARALEMGLHIATHWDWPHVQHRPGVPTDYYSIAQLERVLRERWGDSEP